MKVFKPISNKHAVDLDKDSDFFKHSHGLSVDNEFTLCGYACEEWGYTYTVDKKRITCPDCLDVIDHCATY